MLGMDRRTKAEPRRDDILTTIHAQTPHKPVVEAQCRYRRTANRGRPDAVIRACRIAQAKADGRWAAAYSGQAAATVPDDLATALAGNAAADQMFRSLNGANRYWCCTALRMRTAPTRALAGSTNSARCLLEVKPSIPSHTHGRNRPSLRVPLNQSAPRTDLPDRCSLAPSAAHRAAQPLRSAVLVGALAGGLGENPLLPATVTRHVLPIPAEVDRGSDTPAPWPPSPLVMRIDVLDIGIHARRRPFRVVDRTGPESPRYPARS